MSGRLITDWQLPLAGTEKSCGHEMLVSDSAAPRSPHLASSSALIIWSKFWAISGHGLVSADCSAANRGFAQPQHWGKGISVFSSSIVQVPEATSGLAADSIT